MINGENTKVDHKFPDGYERDATTGAILNTDATALHRHKERRKNKCRLDQLESLCKSLQSELKDVRKILKECLDQTTK